MTMAKQGGAGRQPNIVLVVMDDMGFSDPGCFGGEIATPNLNRLAEQGVRFTQCYNAGRCWPSRASLLTGYYAPQVCMDPPVRHWRPPWQRMLPHYLADAGYRSYHSGKWHVFNTQNPATDGGFDRSWGYATEEFNHFFHGADGRTRFSATAITDHALSCLEAHDRAHRGTPFFHYVCYTTPHFPVQAEPRDIEKYRHYFDEGWDVMRARRWQRMRDMGIVNCALSAREPDVPAPHYHTRAAELQALLGPGEIGYAVPWDALTAAQQRFQATKMAIHAAMVDRTDRELGRILCQLETMGVRDDTLILFLSDNGASAEIMIRGRGHDPDAPPGSATTHLCLGPGWSTCANTPFRRHKIWVHEGGVATPLIACWPNGIVARGGLRHDLAHCIDFLPTCAELAGVPVERRPRDPEAPPLPGRSLVPAFEGGPRIERPHLYFHHEGNRALRVGDWKLVNEALVNQGTPDDRWALYDLATDRCEMADRAAAEPERLREMRALWEKCEAEYRNPGPV